MSKKLNQMSSTRRIYTMAYRFSRIVSCNTREYDPAIHPMSYAGYKRQLDNLSTANWQAYIAAQHSIDAAWHVRDFNAEPIVPRFAYAMKTEEPNEWPY